MSEFTLTAHALTLELTLRAHTAELSIPPMIPPTDSNALTAPQIYVSVILTETASEPILPTAPPVPTAVLADAVKPLTSANETHPLISAEPLTSPIIPPLIYPPPTVVFLSAVEPVTTASP